MRIAAIQRCSCCEESAFPAGNLAEINSSASNGRHSSFRILQTISSIRMTCPRCHRCHHWRKIQPTQRNLRSRCEELLFLLRHVGNGKLGMCNLFKNDQPVVRIAIPHGAQGFGLVADDSASAFFHFLRGVSPCPHRPLLASRKVSETSTRRTPLNSLSSLARAEGANVARPRELY